MELINLTPHAITIACETGHRFPLVIPPSGMIARRDAAENRAGYIALDGDVPIGIAGEGEYFPAMSGKIPVISRELGPVTGLPKPEAGKVFLVSSLVLQSPEVRGRADVFAPDTGPSAIRDTTGRVTAVTRLVAAPSVPLMEQVKGTNAWMRWFFRNA